MSYLFGDNKPQARFGDESSSDASTYDSAYTDPFDQDSTYDYSGSYSYSYSDATQTASTASRSDSTSFSGDDYDSDASSSSDSGDYVYAGGTSGESSERHGCVGTTTVKFDDGREPIDVAIKVFDVMLSKEIRRYIGATNTDYASDDDRFNELKWLRREEKRLRRAQFTARHVMKKTNDKESGAFATPHLIHFYDVVLFNDYAPRDWRRGCEAFYDIRLRKGEAMIGFIFEQAQYPLQKFLETLTDKDEPLQRTRRLRKEELRALAFQMVQGLHALQLRAGGRHLDLSLRQIMLVQTNETRPRIDTYEFGKTGYENAKRYATVSVPAKWHLEDNDLGNKGVLPFFAAISDYELRGEYMTQGAVSNKATPGLILLDSMRKTTTPDLDLADFESDDESDSDSSSSVYRAENGLGPDDDTEFIRGSSFFSPNAYFVRPGKRYDQGYDDDIFAMALILLESGLAGLPALAIGQAQETWEVPEEWARREQYGPMPGMNTILDMPFASTVAATTSIRTQYEEAVTDHVLEDPKLEWIINLCNLQQALGNTLLPNPDLWPGLAETQLYQFLKTIENDIPAFNMRAGGQRFYDDVVVKSLREAHGDTFVDLLKRMLSWEPEARMRSAWLSMWPADADDMPEGEGALMAMYAPYFAPLAQFHETAGEDHAPFVKRVADKMLCATLQKNVADELQRNVDTFSWSTKRADVELAPVKREHNGGAGASWYTNADEQTLLYGPADYNNQLITTGAKLPGTTRREVISHMGQEAERIRVDC